MAIQRSVYTVDDVWEMQHLLGRDDAGYELIEGELVPMSPANLLHSWLASEISGYLREFLRSSGFGYVFVEAGFYPSDDRQTLLAPDVAFVSKARLGTPFPQSFIGLMPDLAVEIASPGNTLIELQEKAAIYLKHGARVVWIVIPDEKSVEVCRIGADEELQCQLVGSDGVLSGEDVLPGFELELWRLFAQVE